MPICVECEYHGERINNRCNNPDLPITDFVRGLRECKILNDKGDCKGFKPQSQNQSIYELKEDEELAKTDATTD